MKDCFLTILEARIARLLCLPARASETNIRRSRGFASQCQPHLATRLLITDRPVKLVSKREHNYETKPKGVVFSTNVIRGRLITTDCSGSL